MIASQLLDGYEPGFSGNKEQLVKLAGQALYASKITSYA